MERSVAWLSLDAGDNEPVRFTAYFLAALQSIDPDIGQTAEVRRFLLQTAILGRLTAALYDAVIEDRVLGLRLGSSHPE